MSLKDQTTLRIVLYDGNGGLPLDPQHRFSAVTALLEKGFAVSSTSRNELETPDRNTLLVLGRFASEPASTQAQQAGVRFQNIAGLNPVAISQLPDLLPKVRLIDARPADEFRIGRLAGARSFPWRDIDDGKLPLHPRRTHWRNR